MIEYLLTNETEINSINQALYSQGLLNSSETFYKNLSLSTFSFYEQFIAGTLKVLPLAPSTIPSSAFMNFSNLTKINLSNTRTIQQAAFKNCSQLQNILTSSSITLYSEAFANCINLKEITIDYFSINGDSIFFNCNKLSKIYILNSIATITLNNTTHFKNTPFDNEYVLQNNISFGTIYVSLPLLTRYQNETNWVELYIQNSQVFQPLPEE